MDYCSACRRILNGALVCPGCGAYAPDIAPPAHHSHGTAASAATASQAWRVEGWPAPGSYPGTHHAEAEPIGSGAPGDAAADASTTGASGGPEGTASTGQGRAARRRQLARWKKNKRRAAAATAVALVGGGLTVAALPATRSSNSHTHAASPPEPVTAATPGQRPPTRYRSNRTPRFRGIPALTALRRRAGTRAPPSPCRTPRRRAGSRSPPPRPPLPRPRAPRRTPHPSRPTGRTRATPRPRPRLRPRPRPLRRLRPLPPTTPAQAHRVCTCCRSRRRVIRHLRRRSV